MGLGKYFNLFASCRIVSGANRSCIFDFNRVKYHFIPNTLFKIIQKYNGETKIESIYNNYPDNKSELDEYFSFLLQNELVFLTNVNITSSFPEVSEHHETPFELSNAILAISKESTYSITGVCKELSEIGTNHLQLRFFAPLELTDILNTIEEVSSLGFRSIEVIVAENPSLVDHSLLRLVEQFRNIALILVFGSLETTVVSKGSKAMEIVMRQKNIIKEKERYIFTSSDYFFLNRQIYHENKHFNAYYNESVSISSKGEIKNALFHNKSFGNVESDSIGYAISESDFRKLWRTKKDESIGCMDCEYRYVCSDNRIPIKSAGDQYWSFEENCLYNPYKSKWRTA